MTGDPSLINLKRRGCVACSLKAKHSHWNRSRHSSKYDAVKRVFGEDDTDAAKAMIQGAINALSMYFHSHIK